MNYEKRFSDLHAAVDDVQTHFQQRMDRNGETEALCRLKLAVHEWMANLVRHARFGDCAPDVHVRVWQENGHFRCIIEDNSNGFDFDSKLAQQAALTEASPTLPEGGMGLLLLKASTEHAEYTPTDEERNRLHLAVSTNGAAPPAEASAEDAST